MKRHSKGYNLLKYSAYKKPFAIRAYHDAVFYCIRSGFRWARYSEDRNSLSVYNLKNPNYSIGLHDEESIRRFKNWYNWMKKQRI